MDHETRGLVSEECTKSIPAGYHVSQAPYEAVLGQMVTIREGGAERRVTATEAFLLHLSKRGLEGDGAAARATLALIEQAKERFSTAHGLIRRIIHVIVAPGSVTNALLPLRMAR